MGTVALSNQHTEVHLKTRLTIIQMILVPMWVIFIVLTFFKDRDFSFGNDGLPGAIPFLIIPVFYIITIASFHYVLSKNLSFLESLIQPVDSEDANSSWIQRN